MTPLAESEMTLAARQNGGYIHRAEMESGIIALIIGGVVAVVTAFVTGLWQWLSGRKKSDMDAQASLVSGFVALLAEFKSEREQLVKRINELESDNQRQDRRMAKLERLMIKHNIDIPENGVT